MTKLCKHIKSIDLETLPSLSFIKKYIHRIEIFIKTNNQKQCLFNIKTTTFKYLKEETPKIKNME